jgi:hypothetical protein
MTVRQLQVLSAPYVQMAFLATWSNIQMYMIYVEKSNKFPPFLTVHMNSQMECFCTVPTIQNDAAGNVNINVCESCYSTFKQ